MNRSTLDALANVDHPAEAPGIAPALAKLPTWTQAEGSPLPLGATWIEEEQAFNFAVHCGACGERHSVALFRRRFGEPSPGVSFRFSA